MKTSKDLKLLVLNLDGKSYGAYKELKGSYAYGDFILSVDHVQGDPFASPSKVRVFVERKKAGIPSDLLDTSVKKVAVGDFLNRTVYKNISKLSNGVRGSGKSGLIQINKPMQQILERTAVIIDDKNIEIRFEIGLPAAGRRILGRSAVALFLEMIPELVEKSLFYSNIDGRRLKEQVEVLLDQEFIRKELTQRGLVSFVGNNSSLPRESGISDEPLLKGVTPFKSPKSMEVTLDLPYHGKLTGMGIKEGITLIVGGGYHGKSTLLEALQLGVYNHIPGDGREWVITRADGMKIRAEDGRSVEKVNITPFINHLPNGKDTSAFTTENASGSTSQAANMIEAIELGSRLLLIDEDTSATNFMIRDARMQLLVTQDKEPITPFIDKVEALYKQCHTSTILVVGGCGDYFDVADQVIMLDEYEVRDVTKEAKDIANQIISKREKAGEDYFGVISSRVIEKVALAGKEREDKVKARGLHTILYGKTTLDLSFVEQLMEEEQTSSIGVMMRYLGDKILDGKMTLEEALEKLYKEIELKGLSIVSPYTRHPGNLALPRKEELASAINRLRGLTVKKIL